MLDIDKLHDFESVHEMQEKERKVYLDYAKGIGILLVILGHVLEFNSGGGGYLFFD